MYLNVNKLLSILLIILCNLARKHGTISNMQVICYINKHDAFKRFILKAYLIITQLYTLLHSLWEGYKFLIATDCLYLLPLLLGAKKHGYVKQLIQYGLAL